MTTTLRLKLALAGALLLLLAACGAGDTLLAGVGSGGTGGGTGGTPTTVIGQIRGFGSVIVNGVHFDESGARITDVDGQELTAQQLRLGMVVQLDGTSDPVALTGVAHSITVTSALRGPVQSASPATGGFVAMGVTVKISAATVFEGLASLQELAAGQQVEVHGYLDPSLGVVGATRVERLASAPAAFRARGVAGEVDEDARTVRIGALLIDYSSASLAGLPDGPKTGYVLELSSSQPPSGDGTWNAEHVALAGAPALRESSRASLEGKIGAFSSVGSFEVQGVRVDASAARFVGGGATSLADGVRVEVEGAFSGGVLRAAEVEIEDEEQHAKEFEVEGTITAVTGPLTFVVRGTTVDASAARFENGSAASIVVGRRAHAVGPVEGGVLRAEKVSFED